MCTHLFHNTEISCKQLKWTAYVMLIMRLKRKIQALCALVKYVRYSYVRYMYLSSQAGGMLTEYGSTIGHGNYTRALVYSLRHI